MSFDLRPPFSRYPHGRGLTSHYHSAGGRSSSSELFFTVDGDNSITFGSRQIGVRVVDFPCCVRGTGFDLASSQECVISMHAVPLPPLLAHQFDHRCSI